MQTRIFLTAIVVAALAAAAADAETTAAAGLQTVVVPVVANQLPQAQQKAASYCSTFGKAAEFQGIRQQRNGSEIALFACV